MFPGRITSKNKPVIYIVAVIIIVVVILLLSQGHGMRGSMHGYRTMGESLNWAQILVSLVIGFLLGLLVSRRRL